MGYTKEEILEKVEDVKLALNDVEEVDEFKAIEAKINDNQKIKNKINDIKKLQKQAVNLQAYGKTEAVKKLDEDIDAIQAEIDALPIVNDYKSQQAIVDHILQTLIGDIDRRVSDVFNQH
ncbi:Cell fate regulator YmcA, YheA/YmcA/DUF963 family (controls sporulation, competence, biofilm development) [Pelagirhabdus alkalitolerans]|uniref:Cell fate regulator YmcA, YheA/YmcA/DUF963 family (Controls sporulation, competence, biofilm development) n=1 Tax=Pelagirhabdus alkalitolerans TaxID=1612202 RepID=A0A1G6H591_9BACI|nr:YlbF family regulator [Pelagirhabdus alkalitolerans]SDB89323.1 Cell fate regulator YmcA, YheA/YmcA/DUF963 family (controls sporulation, competence, biofilm development) [Pelagirhabdus alkalitolerans]